ncbi:unnamed protein product [Blepharisma stoltei]|uniref:Uncharacterized protein n=1 Tax=Blepharisma stoltei TaxID=1481888 RepID=A0AAU9KCR2_9CILI|nr:unnamed protein product [Blepharisma stoltei]
METKEKHRRWRSERLNAYDCFPDNHDIVFSATPMPTSNLYENYLKFKIMHNKPKYSSRKEFKLGPQVALTNKIKPKSSRFSMEIPTALINRRLRNPKAKLSESPVQNSDNREFEIENLITHRKPLNLPSISSHNSPKSHNLHDSIQTTCTDAYKNLIDSTCIKQNYAEDSAIPAWHKEPIRKWNVRPPAIIFPQKSKLKCYQKEQGTENSLKSKMDKTKNDILGILNNCQEDISLFLKESIKFS